MFGEDGDDQLEEVWALPMFEAVHQDDRPPAPSEDDFPIGCVVELVDAMTAKSAQSEFWEPFMEDLFKKPKRKVSVRRHYGDYTFVLCEEDPEFIVGCSLYRACLKEPKVQFRRYVPSEYSAIPTEQAVFGAVSTDDGIIALLGVDGDDDDPLANVIPPEVQRSVGSDSGQSSNGAAAHRRTLNNSLPSSTSLVPTNPQNSEKAKKLTRRGNIAFQEKRYDEAVRHYTQALELDRSEAVRLLSNRSAAYLAAKNAEAGLGDARHATRIAPKNPVGYIRGGNVLRHLKRFDEAKLCYEKALALDPGNPDIEYSLASNAVASVYRYIRASASCATYRAAVGGAYFFTLLSSL